MGRQRRRAAPIRDGIARNAYPNETAVRTQIVQRILHELGWNVFDPRSGVQRVPTKAREDIPPHRSRTVREGPEASLHRRAEVDGLRSQGDRSIGRRQATVRVRVSRRRPIGLADERRKLALVLHTQRRNLRGTSRQDSRHRSGASGRGGSCTGRIPDFPVTRSHPPASWPSAANSSICRTYRKTAGEESRRRSPVANRWMRP